MVSKQTYTYAGGSRRFTVTNIDTNGLNRSEKRAEDENVNTEVGAGTSEDNSSKRTKVETKMSLHKHTGITRKTGTIHKTTSMASLYPKPKPNKENTKTDLLREVIEQQKKTILSLQSTIDNLTKQIREQAKTIHSFEAKMDKHFETGNPKEIEMEETNQTMETDDNAGFTVKKKKNRSKRRKEDNEDSLEETDSEDERPKQTKKIENVKNEIIKPKEKNEFVLPTAPKKNHNENSNEETPKKPKVSPIILKTPGKWNILLRGLNSNKIKYEKATMARNRSSVTIIPASTDDYRRMARYFDEMKALDNEINWVIYELPENKPFKAVMKGIPINVTPKEIEEELIEAGISPIKVQKMTSRRTKEQLPMFLIDVPKDQKDSMLQIQRCAGLVITTEALRPRSSPIQCFQCQEFHHAQSNCHVNPKCVRCGEEHRAAECPRNVKDPPTCANCKGDHTANYRGCPRAPKPTNLRPSYASITRENNPKPKTTEPTNNARQDSLNIQDMMKKMETFQKMFHQMASFFNMNCNA